MVTDKRFIFIRHGESQAQAARKMGVDRSDQSLLDCGLTQQGVNQAFSLGKQMIVDDLENTVIVCSPLTRALQTALIAFPTVKKIVHSDLKEIGSDIPENIARPLSDLSDDTSLSLLPGWEYIDWTELPKKWPNTKIKKLPQKSKKELKKEFRQRMLKYLSSRQEDTIIVICHYHVIHALISESSVRVSNCIPIEAHLQKQIDKSGEFMFHLQVL